MPEAWTFARSELILGGQKSGKSRRAETLAASWLAGHPERRAVLIATAFPGDDEMRQRIARHQQDRAERVPALTTVEAPVELAEAIVRHAGPHTMVVVDCLTLWLTNLVAPLPARNAENMPIQASNRPVAGVFHAPAAIDSIAQACQPDRLGALVFVSNEIGLGVIPMGSLTREFVDTLGLLNQRLAACCDRVTLMAAGLPLALKGSS
jgi:adenosylcobinamide kinase / adenosylcobinamide-phosphate guanylyltransferase